MDLEILRKDLRKFARSDKAKFLPGFFQIGREGYPKKDIFIGAAVPNCRLVAKKYKDLTLNDSQILLQSECHEERLTALMILVSQFKNNPKETFEFYLKNTKYIDNWDLVDLSCSKIVGQYLLDKPRDILYKLTLSKNIWERRIAIISTYTFIKLGQLEDTIKISEKLLGDKHDLIHKAVGWMLREIGKKNESLLVKFLKKNYSLLSRTTLRYAIERFPENIRKGYLQGNFDAQN